LAETPFGQTRKSKLVAIEEVGQFAVKGSGVLRRIKRRAKGDLGKPAENSLTNRVEGMIADGLRIRPTSRSRFCAGLRPRFLSGF
jgi:hypothetical protein